MDSSELINRIAQKDVQALKKAIELYGGYVHAVLRHTVKGIGEQEDFEELTSDVFAKLWDSAEKLKEDSNLKAWLAVVARNSAYRWARGQHKTLELSEEALTTDNHVKDFASLQDQQMAVREAIAKLEDPNREIVERYYLKDQSVAQISNETGLSQENIKSRLHRSRIRLREILAKGGYGE